MKTVKVKDLELGAGSPKIIVSIMGKDEASLMKEAEFYKTVDFDIIEWRIDHFADVKNIEAIKATGVKLRKTFASKPILFTFRTKKEGGEQEISVADYIALNKTMVDSGNVDMIDLEVFTGDKEVKETTEYAHAKGVKVVMSNHDFHKTPAKEEIVIRLKKMQELGADIPKIALMPQNSDDVLTLLTATNEMHKKYADRPIITMSMGKIGVVSRLCGEVFGSCATFGAAKVASAPGQIDAKELRAVLNILHR